MDRAQRAEKVLAVVETFVRDQRISCSEAVYQTDRVIENAQELIDRLAKIAGFWKDPDDDA